MGLESPLSMVTSENSTSHIQETLHIKSQCDIYNMTLSRAWH